MSKFSGFAVKSQRDCAVHVAVTARTAATTEAAATTSNTAALDAATE
jgi:hypothetical protein